jgi:hypothetical protein
MTNNNDLFTKNNDLLNGLFSNSKFQLSDKNEHKNMGDISQQDRLLVAKQVLFGLAILFIITVIAYLIRPAEGQVLLEICKTVFPPLATLIIAFYFKS